MPALYCAGFLAYEICDKVKLIFFLLLFFLVDSVQTKRGWVTAVPSETRSRSSLCLAAAKLSLRLTACDSLSTEAQQRFLMAHAAIHPFLV